MTYGQPFLRKKCNQVKEASGDLDILIQDMWQTLENARGAGLAALQVGKDLKLFLVDSTSTFNQIPGEDLQHIKSNKSLKQVFINAEILEQSEEKASEVEGCLSIPGVEAEVVRPVAIKLKYQDEKLNEHIDYFDGPNARIIQHELDHTLGVLYLDHLSELRRNLMKAKLKKIATGKSKSNYPMR